MKAFSRSLFARLSRRLIVLQLVALILVVIVASIPETERRGMPDLDESVLDNIADNLEGAGDSLAVRRDPELAEIMEANPDFWFLVGDDQGRSMNFGPVPNGVLPLFRDVGSVARTEIYWRGPDVGGGIIGRRIDSPIGMVSVISGGGPTLYPVLGRLQRIDPFYLLLLAGLMTLSALAIPYLLRKDLSGVERVADEAAHIDIDQPGARLTEANVPPELQVMVGAVNAALSRLDEGLEKRKRFLATAAHELRTPLAILTMRIELMPPGPERNQLLLDVARLSSLANQLLDLQRLDGDHVHLERLDLCVLVARAVQDIAPLAVASQANLSFDAPSDAITILADEQSIIRVVTNLIQNAIAHGGRFVTIEVEVARPCELRVRDNGPGIPPEDRAQVFEPFFRRSSGTGSGLGLHLVRDIVSRHGATIHTQEPAGGGVEFIVRFPPA
ncbi:MAG: sensor histidine kinase [Cereibacter sphaeroides]|uniref:histidine kinase n=1 Tax=Cereibacter sphaeroides TaxID=1063 RepID=A0A2W5S783_CERSP|nr:MAG: sensor histidine kinase [Cereibacter sphaeroides]